MTSPREVIKETCDKHGLPITDECTNTIVSDLAEIVRELKEFDENEMWMRGYNQAITDIAKLFTDKEEVK